MQSANLSNLLFRIDYNVRQIMLIAIPAHVDTSSHWAAEVKVGESIGNGNDKSRQVSTTKMAMHD